MSSVTLKRCYHCEETKNLEAFGQNKSKPDGRCTECKACVKLLYAQSAASSKLKRDQKRRGWAAQVYYLALEGKQPTKSCTECGIEKPATANHFHKAGHCQFGVRGTCKECLNAKANAKYLADPEKRRSQARASYKANPEKTHASNERWRKANPEKRRAMGLAWARANPEKSRLMSRLYWSKNPEKRRANKAARRAQKAATGGSFTAAEWRAKLAQYGGRCHWCSKKIKGAVHADHVIPLAKGGSSFIDNIVPSCAGCNLKKGAKLPHEFAGRLF